MNRLFYAIASALIIGSASARAEEYSIGWYSLDGGGRTSTGGVYMVMGTIGQPDAGKLVGENYSIEGGFWGFLGVFQAPAAPWLEISRTATNSILISWPSPSTGWSLQRNTNLNTTTWVNVSVTPDDDGSKRSIVVAPPIGNHFYRMMRE